VGHSQEGGRENGTPDIWPRNLQVSGRVETPLDGTIKTAIHFQKHDDPKQAKIIEKNGQFKNLSTGVFLIARWEKPVET
jgi:hypothetical protein